MLKILHHPSCSKSRKILEILDENAVEFELIDFVADPLSPEEIQVLVRKHGEPYESLVRTQDPLFKERYEGMEFSAENVARLLEQSGELLQRPIAVSGGVAMVLRPSERLYYFFKK